MADPNKARKLDISVSVSDEEVAPVSISCQLGAGNYASCSVQYAQKKEAGREGSITVYASDVFQYIGDQQDKMYGAPEENQTLIDMFGTDEGLFTFSGYVSSPSYNFTAYDVGRGVQSLAQYSVMECLDFSIYRPNADTALIENNWEGVETISDFILNYVKKLVKDWSPDKLENANEFTKKAAERQHETNSQYIEYFYRLLQNSKETMGWKDSIKTMQEVDPNAQAMMSRVSLILAQSTGGFLNTINAIAEEFQCVWAPSFTDVGKFVNKSLLFEESGEDIQVDMVSIDVEAGNKYGLFPLSYVAVCPPMQNADTGLIQDSLQYTTYPEDASGVVKLVSVGPGWYPPNMPSVPAKEEKTGEEKAKEGIDASGAEQEVQGVKDGSKENEEKKGDILKEWAKNMYLWESLAPSQCTIICVPTFKKYEICKRYTVKNSEGDDLFSGVLMGITHVVRGGNNPQMFTQLNFTHITCGAFTLPGVS